MVRTAIRGLVWILGDPAVAGLSSKPVGNKPARRRVRTPEQLEALREYGRQRYRANKRARPAIRLLEAAWYGR